MSGLDFGERLELQRTLERSLALALALSLLFGVICGLVTAGYVGGRVRAIAAVVDDIGAGDLARRAPIAGSGDAFDLLSTRINLMLDRIGVLMGELRLLTDSLAHDLRSPVSRLRARIESAMTVDDEVQRDAPARRRAGRGRFADAHPDDGAGDRPQRGDGRARALRPGRSRRARGRDGRDVRAAGRGGRGSR